MLKRCLDQGFMDQQPYKTAHTLLTYTKSIDARTKPTLEGQHVPWGLQLCSTAAGISISVPRRMQHTATACYKTLAMLSIASSS